MNSRRARDTIDPMPTFLLSHRHEPHECETAFEAWRGFKSPLRHRFVASSCLAGEHGLWWRVEAASRTEAIALLPRFVAERTVATRIREVEVP